MNSVDNIDTWYLYHKNKPIALDYSRDLYNLFSNNWFTTTLHKWKLWLFVVLNDIKIYVNHLWSWKEYEDKIWKDIKGNIKFSYNFSKAEDADFDGQKLKPEVIQYINDQDMKASTSWAWNKDFVKIQNAWMDFYTAMQWNNPLLFWNKNENIQWKSQIIHYIHKPKVENFTPEFYINK